MVAPIDLGPMYAIDFDHHLMLCLVISQFMILATIAFLSNRLLFVGWAWYLITLLPVIGLVKIGESTHSDRYTYLPSIGLLLMAVTLAKDVLDRRVLIPIAAIVMLGLGITTRYQLSFWRDDVSLWKRAVEVSDKSPYSHFYLGASLASSNHKPSALVAFQASAELGKRMDECRQRIKRECDGRFCATTISRP